MITFSGVSKRFADGTVAVDRLDLEIKAGELTVLVGPSGCGKTTSLRMINRLEESSDGIITVDRADIRTVDATQLRRGIGYVMQHSGLFPHRTIRDNIAVVPGLLGWNRKTIRARVDELIDLVGLEPDLAARYPHQLSGGQQQRVGVARALAADPPIMLMDEPFTAVDPIVRKRLQDEFLGLQQRLKKTIVFVTHDIDEAIKLGDRIAILEDGGRLAQYARPRELLAEPRSDFVVDFLGAERELKRLALIKVSDIDVERGPVVWPDAPSATVSAVAADYGSDWVVVIDTRQRLLGWQSITALGGVADARQGSPLQTFAQTVSASTSLRAALGAMVTSPLGVVPYVDADRRYRGLVTHACLNGQLS